MDCLWVPKPSMGCNSCRHFFLGSLQRQCQMGRLCSNKGWGYKVPKLPWPPFLQRDCHFQPVAIKPLVCMTSPPPNFVWPCKGIHSYVWRPREGQGLDLHLSLDVVRGNPASILAGVQVRSNLMYWPVSLPATYPSACIAIAFWILVLSVSFIVPSVVKCYFEHWLNILSIAQLMVRLQHSVMFKITWWNLWGSKKLWVDSEKKGLCKFHLSSYHNAVSTLIISPTVAASNNRYHAPQSLYYCLFTPHIYGCYSLHTSRSWWIAHWTQR